MEPKNSILCPHCNQPINVSDVLFHQISEQIKQQYDVQLAQKDEEFKAASCKLQQDREKLEKDQESLQAKVDSEVKLKVATQKSAMEKSIRAKIDEEKSEQLKALEEELNEKSKKVSNFNKLKADLARIQREKDELRATIEAESEVNLNEQLAQEKAKITATEAEKAKLEIQKKEKLISDLQGRLDDAQKKLELGTSANKLVGEITEIELRDFLRQTYPIDAVDDVPSGIRGADVIQSVRNNLGAECGILLYERKSTQNFSEGWIEKLREDGRRVSADILILVTRAFPKDIQTTHFRNGVWVTTFTDLGLLTNLLRDGLIKQFSALSSMQDKTSKMDLIYSYLLSNDFVNQITALLDAYRKMERSLAKEKETAMKQFAERESHIWAAKKSILGFYGRIEGITQSALTEQVKMLEEPPQQIES